jgi:hypothetical protein
MNCVERDDDAIYDVFVTSMSSVGLAVDVSIPHSFIDRDQLCRRIHT